MAPALDGLPAAEREVDVAGPVGEFLTSLSPRVLTRVRLGLRAFEWLPFPWRFSRLDPAAREDFLRRMEGSRFGLYHELLLMAKTFTTLGYAVDPQVEEEIGPGDELPRRRRLAARAGRVAGRHSRRPARARNATWSSSARAPAAPWPRRRSPRPGST